MSDANTVQVKMAEARISKAPMVLEAIGLGSCVAICLYDPTLKIGGLAHAMLPSIAEHVTIDKLQLTSQRSSVKGQMSDVNLLKYADYAIDWMVSELGKLGSTPSALVTKVVGGADMFGLAPHNPGSIGSQTVKTVEEKLKSLGLKLKTEDVGENVGRSVSFDLQTGIVTVSTKM